MSASQATLTGHSFLLYLIREAFHWQSCSASLFKVHFLAFRKSLAAAVSSEDRASGADEAGRVFIPCVLDP